MDKKRGRPSIPRLVDVYRFRELVDEASNKGVSRQKIADEIGCDVSTITKHYNGNSPIDLKYLCAYANYFDVSTDYLLGLSAVSSADPAIKAICEKFGLKEKDLDLLKNAFYHREEIADAALEIREFADAAEYLRNILCFGI